jgi:hypothetical protein
MANVTIAQEELDALTSVKVVGAVSSDQIAAMSRQLASLTQWVKFLDDVRTGAGGGTVPPPPPPKWPP